MSTVHVHPFMKLQNLNRPWLCRETILSVELVLKIFSRQWSKRSNNLFRTFIKASYRFGRTKYKKSTEAFESVPKVSGCVYKLNLSKYFRTSQSKGFATEHDRFVLNLFYMVSPISTSNRSLQLSTQVLELSFWTNAVTGVGSAAIANNSGRKKDNCSRTLLTYSSAFRTEKKWQTTRILPHSILRINLQT